MVISAEPPPPPPPDPVADAAASGTSSARQASFSSLSSLKAWGSHRGLRCAHVNRDIATARRPAEQLCEAGEKLPRRHDEVEAAVSDAPAADAEEEPPAGSSPSKLRAPRRRRPRRGAVALPASASPPVERRPPRAVRGEHLVRPRFSVTLTTEEIEEDVYAVTGARARRRPRRRPRPVQKQLHVSAADPLPPS
jgi:hypothetical protein